MEREALMPDVVNNVGNRWPRGERAYEPMTMNLAVMMTPTVYGDPVRCTRTDASERKPSDTAPLATKASLSRLAFAVGCGYIYSLRWPEYAVCPL